MRRIFVTNDGKSTADSSDVEFLEVAYCLGVCSHCTMRQKFLGTFFKKVRVSRPQAHRRFFWELFFAPFWSKKSGVPVYTLQQFYKA